MLVMSEVWDLKRESNFGSNNDSYQTGSTCITPKQGHHRKQPQSFINNNFTLKKKKERKNRV